MLEELFGGKSHVNKECNLLVRLGLLMFPFSNNTDGSLSSDLGKKSVDSPAAPNRLCLKCVFS